LIFLKKIGRTPLMRINCEGEPSGYAENPDNWIFLLQIGYMVSLQLDCYYVQYVSASKTFDHAWFEVPEAITLCCTALDLITGNFNAS